MRRVVQQDLRLGAGGRTRDQSLLEEVVRLPCRYASQAAGRAIFMNELHSVRSADIGWRRVLAYQRFPNDTL
jgi:hypothetical protein